MGYRAIIREIRIKNFRSIVEAKKNSVDHTFIWGYEEPENGVEFFSCSKLADEIYSYSSNIQIFITTHSPAIYSKNDAENVKCYYTYKSESGDSKYCLLYTSPSPRDRG